MLSLCGSSISEILRFKELLKRAVLRGSRKLCKRGLQSRVQSVRGSWGKYLSPPSHTLVTRSQQCVFVSCHFSRDVSGVKLSFELCQPWLRVIRPEWRQLLLNRCQRWKLLITWEWLDDWSFRLTWFVFATPSLSILSNSWSPVSRGRKDIWNFHCRIPFVVKSQY